jgi:hypothetical protein
MTSSKQQLLDAYATKPVQRFLQVDGFCDVWADDVMGPDDDGDSLMLGITHELMSSPGRLMPARLLIHEDADPEDVRRLLEKALENLDGALEYLRQESDRELLARAGIKSEAPF